MSTDQTSGSTEQPSTAVVVVPATTTTTIAVAPTTKNQAYTILLDGLGAFRNGIVYGTKVRAPHSFVVHALWSSNTWPNVFRKIVVLTAQHATNLAVAAMTFKIGMHLLKLASPSAVSQWWHYFMMGGVGGFFVWGEPNAVNVQVNMYMMSRVLSGLLFLWIEHREREEAQRKKQKQIAIGDALSADSTSLPASPAASSSESAIMSPVSPKTTGDDNVSLLKPWEQFVYGPRGYRVFVGIVWATALYLFHHHDKYLQSSLKMSMQYIYKDGDKHAGSLRHVLLGY